MSDCIFCKITDGEAPAEIEFENENVIAFNSIEPVSKVHVLVVPKKHIANFLEISADNIVLEMTKVAQRIIDDKKIADGYKLVFNGGKYQAVPHLHWHVLGGALENKSDILNQT